MLRLLAIRLEEHGRESAATLAARACRVAELGVGLVESCMLLLVCCLLLTEARVVDGRQKARSLALSAVVHQSLDRLLSLEASWLHLVEGSIHDLSVHGLELSKVSEIDLDVGLLAHELANDSEDVVERDLECLLLEVDVLGHSRVGWLDRRPEHDGRLALEFGHRGAILKAVRLEEVLGKLDVDDFLTLSQRLEADDAEVGHCDSSVDLDLLDAPPANELTL